MHAVDADLDLDDILDAVRGAAVEFLLLDAARRGRDVGRVAADTGAETLEATAGARAVDLRRLVARRFSELLADRGGKGIDGRGPDRADIIARAAARRRLILARGKRQRARRGTSDAKQPGSECLQHEIILWWGSLPNQATTPAATR